MSRIFAVGDLQGCLAPLERLLEDVNFDPSVDQLWCVGDLVNRGPDSLGTLRFLYRLRNSVKVVLGNHDLHLLAIAYGQKRPKGHEDLLSIVDAFDSHELLSWLRQQPLFYWEEVNNLAMAHAGIPPFWSPKQAMKRSKEVEAVLQSDQHIEFYAAMYGNKPERWNKKLEGMDRLRVIVNYFTRMRFLGADQELELTSKEGKGSAPKNCKPWFEFENKLDETLLLFGHWAALEGLFDHQDVVGLDTGCVWGGKLTMLNTQSGRLHQRSLK